MASARPASGVSDAALLHARLAAVSAHEAERLASQQAAWRRESEALGLQISAMEETIALVEREIKIASAQLEKEAAAKESAAEGERSSDREVLRAQLEDKLLRTQQELEEARLAYFFPQVEGYQLRFSYGETYLGFKELLLEHLRGTLTLSASPGAADGALAEPSVRLRWEGSGEGIGREPGGLLRFMGEGVSLVTRREVLGLALEPNITLPRLDVSARFEADIPLVYSSKRRSWRLGPEFKVELLDFQNKGTGGVSGAAAEHLLRILVQVVVEGVTRQLLISSVGAHLGEYLRASGRGGAVAVEVTIHGVPVATFDAPLAGGGEGARHAAELLGVQKMLPDLAGAHFRTLADLVRYFVSSVLGGDLHKIAELSRQADGGRAHLRAVAKTSPIVAVWEEALENLRATAAPAAAAAATADSQQQLHPPPLRFEALLESVAALARKPATVALRCRRLDISIAPARALSEACAALAEQLSSSGVGHGSASSLLDTFREQALATVGALGRALRSASATCTVVVHGGGDGSLRLEASDARYAGTAAVSAHLAPPEVTPYRLSSSVLPDGRVHVELALPSRALGGGEVDGAGGGGEAGGGAPDGGGSEAGTMTTLVEAQVAHASASLYVGDAEALRVALVQGARPLPASPPAPPLWLPPLPARAPLAPADGADADAAQRTPSVHATSSAHAAGTPSPRVRADGGATVTRMVDVYEHERRLTVLRPYSAEDLLPNIDVAPWADEAGRAKYDSRAAVPLPGAGWRWVGEWRIDVDGGCKAADGWQYALSWNTGWIAASNPLTHVRRRRWVCAAELPPPNPPPPPPLAAAAIGGPATATGPPTSPTRSPASGGLPTSPRPTSPRVAGSPPPTWQLSPPGSPRGACEGTSLLGEASPAAAPAADAPPSVTSVPGDLGAALLRLSVAPGAHVRVRVDGVTARARALPLVEHASRLLLDALEDDPWYSRPLDVAYSRLRTSLASPKLRLQATIGVSADNSPGDEGGEDSSGGGEGLRVDFEGRGMGGGAPCVFFRHEINLIDFVSDVREIYRAFASNIASQTPHVSRSNAEG